MVRKTFECKVEKVNPKRSIAPKIDEPLFSISTTVNGYQWNTGNELTWQELLKVREAIEGCIHH